jgi:uncharacterized Ntn-hydrolase superfamily protein
VLSFKIHYLEAGAGAPVVLLHGLGGDGSLWAPNIGPLAADFRIFALDQIGFGQSDKPLANYHTGMLSEFLVGFLKAIGVQKASLVGISMGGTVAAYTGANCIPDAGNKTGNQYTVQANLMANPSVWPAMSEAYEKAQGDLAERMLQALEAGQKAGGDIRGRQSAAIVVVKAQGTGKPWADRVMDLRVEDSDEPIKELRRLVRLRRAYNLEDAGDNFISEKKPAEALQAYEAAMKLAPDVVELQFWAAVSMYTNGREREGLDLFRRVFARERRWIDLVPRLARAGLFPNDAKKLAEVRAQAGAGPGTR